jgi:sodium-dependent dicarboxylate transporter 2/3/5
MSEFVTSLRAWALALGPLAGVGCAFWLTQTGSSGAAAITLAVTVTCVVWWIFEPIPIPATALLPLAVFPLTGVLPQSTVSESYGNPLILLLLGGFLLSTAMAKSGAHRRIALMMVSAFGGTNNRRLVYGFMAASASLSMWISNTATALMLLPVALAIIERAENPKLAGPLLLGIAYAASVGGIGTPIGTPPNLIFMSIYQTTTGNEISFLQWASWGVPVVLVFVPIMAVWLTRTLEPQGAISLPEVGRWRKEEVRTLAVFVVTATLWITRGEPFGGWTAWTGLPYSNDAIVALAAVVAMFLIPNGQGGRLLDWESAERIPWGVLILFGGGITIAEAFDSSGLSTSIGDALSSLTNWHVYSLMIIICFCVTFLTEATSNTATTALLMPILAAMAIGAGMDPRLVMVPAAMSASCAFMLPVATAPNVIMFSTGRFAVRDMVREGFALNLIGVVIISALCYLLIG